MPNPIGRRLCKAVTFAAIGFLLPSAVVLAQEAPPAAPSNEEAIAVTLPDGSAGVQVSWTDNSENELGFLITDEGTGQRYDSLPNPEGAGARLSLTIPVASGCFHISAYNNYGESPQSGAVCVPAKQGPSITFGWWMPVIVLPILLLAAVLTVVVIRKQQTAGGNSVQ
jgi:hypothetical protein